MKKNQTVTLDVTDLNNLGYGVGHLPDGMTVFIKGAVTGDRAEVKLIKVASTYCVGRMERLLCASPYRLSDEDCGTEKRRGDAPYVM